jgi:hypothetical protein
MDIGICLIICSDSDTLHSFFAWDPLFSDENIQGISSGITDLLRNEIEILF